MVKEINILCLKGKIINLKRIRSKRYNYIISNRSKDLHRVNSVEDIDINFFTKIDKEIDKINRLLRIKKVNK